MTQAQRYTVLIACRHIRCAIRQTYTLTKAPDQLTEQATTDLIRALDILRAVSTTTYHNPETKNDPTTDQDNL